MLLNIKSSSYEISSLCALLNDVSREIERGTDGSQSAVSLPEGIVLSLRQNIRDCGVLQHIVPQGSNILAERTFPVSHLAQVQIQRGQSLFSEFVDLDVAHDAVSYTHLTLPTIYSVQISVVAVSLKKKKQHNSVNVSLYINELRVTKLSK
eukprot:TRINITY_DN5071_c0_g1_i2.p1 TRINITY_DN5071_c0_g1~~TRINITY_DN5071_c0_g1_i2.p1  ORF type:complete len:151 (-),score=7.05 TRINITY_DN5071_c0_g1_i2:3-455(-)